MLAPCWLDFYCDWGAEVPLWIDGSGMAYAQSVPVSEVLRRDLVAYQARFEDGFGEDDDAPYPDGFLAAGRELLERVRAELPSPPWRITSRLWLEPERRV